MRAYLFKLLILIAICTFSFSCKNNISENKQKTASGKIVIYQVMTRLFGNDSTANIYNGTIQQNGVGKFNDFTTTALDSIKSLGCTHIWFTGVIAHASKTDYSKYGIDGGHKGVIKGNAGSPYAIRDYYDVNPDLAVNVKNRMKEYQELINRCHEAGLKVIMDFVPNHVARNYKSIAKPKGVIDLGENDNTGVLFSPNNNFYYLPDELKPGFDCQGYKESPAKATGNDVFNNTPSQDDWYETIKLNYGIDYSTNEKHFSPIPDTWNKMKDILLFWAAKGVDGFRADMAEMVPVEFWQWGISNVKNEYPNCLFIAEIYNPQAYKAYIKQGNFDYLYDKVGLYDTLKSIIKGISESSAIAVNSKNLQEIGFSDNDTIKMEDHMLNFLENHDEQRIASVDFADNALAGIPMAIVSACYTKGPYMLYFAQDLGEAANGAEGFGSDDGRTSIFDYCSVPTIVKWRNKGNYDGAEYPQVSGLSKRQKDLHKFYRTLLNLVSQNKIFAEGSTEVIIPNNCSNPESLFAFTRTLNNEKVLCVVNFGLQEQQVQLSQFNSTAKDLLSKKELSLANVNIAPLSGFIFQLSQQPQESH